MPKISRFFSVLKLFFAGKTSVLRAEKTREREILRVTKPLFCFFSYFNNPQTFESYKSKSVLIPLQVRCKSVHPIVSRTNKKRRHSEWRTKAEKTFLHKPYTPTSSPYITNTNTERYKDFKYTLTLH